MVDIFAMTLEVILRPFYIELLQLHHFVAFLYLLFDMVSLMQTLFKTGIFITRLQKKADRIFPVTLKVTSRPFKLNVIVLVLPRYCWLHWVL